MCLGASARAANQAERNKYEFELKKREQNWMQTRSLTAVERIQYEQGITASNLGLAQVYGDIQEKHGDMVGQVLQENEGEWQRFLQQSTGANLAASGVTGKSANRTATLDLAAYLRGTSRRAYALTEATEELTKEGQKAAGQARAEQMQMFANNAFIKHPDLAPPPPVYQNEGFAMFQDALKIGTSIATIAAAPWAGAAGATTVGGALGTWWKNRGGESS